MRAQFSRRTVTRGSTGLVRRTATSPGFYLRRQETFRGGGEFGFRCALFASLIIEEANVALVNKNARVPWRILTSPDATFDAAFVEELAA